MTRYEYKVVPAPSRGVKAKGVKGAEARFAYGLEQVLQEMGAAGWEYLRAETLPSEERAGLTASVTNWRTVLVFRRVEAAEPLVARPLIAAPELEADPAPKAEAPRAAKPAETVAVPDEAVADTPTPEGTSEPDDAATPAQDDAKPAEGTPRAAPPEEEGETEETDSLGRLLKDRAATLTPFSKR